MKCCSEKTYLAAHLYFKGFSLPEVVTALIILALISSSVLVVINRCIAASTNSVLRMQAFEVARENMETLLSKGSVTEMAEYGYSDKYPAVQWQTTVETSYEPITQRTWAIATCSAEYTDIQGNVQTIELTHWLTSLTKQQLTELTKREEEEQKQLAEQDMTTKDKIRPGETEGPAEDRKQDGEEVPELGPDSTIEDVMEYFRKNLK